MFPELVSGSKKILWTPKQEKFLNSRCQQIYQL